MRREHGARRPAARPPDGFSRLAPGGASRAVAPRGVQRVAVGAEHLRRDVCQAAPRTPQGARGQRGPAGQQLPSLGHERGRHAVPVQHVSGPPASPARGHESFEADKRLQIKLSDCEINFFMVALRAPKQQQPQQQQKLFQYHDFYLSVFMN